MNNNNKETLLQMAQISEAEGDIFLTVRGERINIYVNDCEGYDDDWIETYRDLENQANIDKIEQWLKDNCIKSTEEIDGSTSYAFEDFEVNILYSSIEYVLYL